MFVESEVDGCCFTRCLVSVNTRGLLKMAILILRHKELALKWERCLLGSLGSRPEV